MDITCLVCIAFDEAIWDAALLTTAILEDLLCIR
jgi:hypothetical protein